MMPTKIRIDIELTDEEHVYLVSQAVKHGFKRIEPRQRWHDKEYKDAVKCRIMQLIIKELKR